MKKILIVDVPEGYIIDSVEIIVKSDDGKFPYVDSILNFTEFTPPTDAEIEKAEDTLHEIGYEDSHFIAGANWMKGKLQ